MNMCIVEHKQNPRAVYIVNNDITLNETQPKMG